MAIELGHFALILAFAIAAASAVFGLWGWQRSDRVECRGGIIYHTNFSLEPVAPDLFWTFQEELSHGGERQGLMHTFDSSGRIALGAVSYIYAETRTRSLLIQAFHTFPDDCAIVKCQSVFELP